MNNLNNELLLKIEKLFNTIIKNVFINHENFNINNIFQKLQTIELNSQEEDSLSNKIIELNDLIKNKEIKANFDVERWSKIRKKLIEIQEKNSDYKIIYNNIIKSYNENNSTIDLKYENESEILQNGNNFKEKIEELWNNNIELKKQNEKLLNDLNNVNFELETKRDTMTYNKNSTKLKEELEVNLIQKEEENEELKNTLNLIIKEKNNIVQDYEQKNDILSNTNKDLENNILILNQEMEILKEEENQYKLIINNYKLEKQENDNLNLKEKMDNQENNIQSQKEAINWLKIDNLNLIEKLNNQENNIQYQKEALDNLKTDNSNLKEKLKNIETQKLVKSGAINNKDSQNLNIYSFKEIHINKSDLSNKSNNQNNNKLKIFFNIILKQHSNIKNISNEFSKFKIKINNLLNQINYSNFKAPNLKISIDKKNVNSFKFISKKLDISHFNFNNLNIFINELLKSAEPLNFELLTSQKQNLKDSYLILLNKYKNYNLFINDKGILTSNLLSNFSQEFQKLVEYESNILKFQELLKDIKSKTDKRDVIDKIISIQSLWNIIETNRQIDKLRNFDNLNINYLLNNYNEKYNSLKLKNQDNNSNLEKVKSEIIVLKNLIKN